MIKQIMVATAAWLAINAAFPLYAQRQTIASSGGLPPVQMPEAKFQDESGKTILLESLKAKVAFINFWTTRCTPCMVLNKNDKVVFKHGGISDFSEGEFKRLLTTINEE